MVWLSLNDLQNMSVAV